MPNTKNFQLLFNSQQADVDLENLDITINDVLEEPENFLSKQGSDAFNITLPCTKQNDKIFNTFHNQNVQDLSPSGDGGIVTFASLPPGTGYVIGEIITVLGGAPPCTLAVIAITGGGYPSALSIVTGGGGYVSGATYSTSSSGLGTGFTLTVTSVDSDSGGSFRSWMDFKMYSNGVIIFVGKAVLVDCTITDKPEYYTVQAVGGSAAWLIDMQNVTLWDCLSTTPHDFTVANVQDSWDNFDSDEDHDYVYAPVRYRQPFGVNDDAVNIYALRPSISIYWLIIRAFRQFGYTVNSQFFNTSNYFRRLVLPWTWGDFYDINSQITDGLSFKAAGIVPNAPPLGFAAPVGFPWIFFSGVAHSSHPSYDPDNTGWTPWHIAVSSGLPPAIGYVHSLTQTFPFAPFNLFQNFIINNVAPPNGYDNFGLYSFDVATGTMIYTFTPPANIIPFIGNNLTIRFAMSLICQTICESSVGAVHELVWIAYTINGGAEVLEPFDELSSTTSGETKGSLLYPTVHNFQIPNVNVGDIIRIRIKYDSSGNLSDHLAIISSGFLNANPSATTANPWQYNPTTQKWENLSYPASTTEWQPMYSSLQMTGLQIALGNAVHFQWYDAFRNYEFTNMLGGLVEAFNLEVKTDPINQVVTFEPMFGTSFPDGTDIDGFFSTRKIIDWTNKRDFTKASKMTLFSNSERQLDFSMKQDGSDGGQNIYAARNKGIYLNNVIKPRLNNTSIENGIIAGVPGASRYMLPDRFSKGNKQINNRFFSSTMHYNHVAWNNIGGFGGPAPQLICIIPENINDSSASAVSQTFEPKLVFYAGKQSILGVGGWQWIGDPEAPYTPGGIPSSIGFQLPYMFAVDYTGFTGTVPGQIAPVLTYCDQNIKGVIEHGLMRRYFLQRMAIIRNGQLLNAVMRLNLNDICNWGHRECIKIENGIFALISIEGYKPMDDESNDTTLWKVVNPEQVDIDSSYPSTASILSYPTTLSQYDLKYAQLLLFPSDIPQVS